MHPTLTRATRFLLVALMLMNGACVTSVSREAPLEKWTPAKIAEDRERLSASDARSPELLVLLAFSGGGTRAASFSYGVLDELRATEIQTADGPRNLQHEIDGISSVSGGSFTAAYFGLKGDGIFDGFEEKFLRKNIEGALIWQVVSPRNWFKLASRGYGRSDLAADYYSRKIFDRATFADLQREDAPLLAINATDLVSGIRFPFVRGYFDLLCADLDQYPVARAVAASSAVPGLLSPISLENYAGSCGYQLSPRIEHAADGRFQTIERFEAEALMKLLDKKERPWLHLVDGGIADNLGLRSIWTQVSVAGGLKGAFPSLMQPGGHQVLVILVNAIAEPKHDWMFASYAPSLLEIIGAVSSIELSRFDLDTIQLTQESFERWVSEASSPNNPVTFHFVDVSFAQVKDEKKREALNGIGTNFSLKDKDVDLLISAAKEVLRESPEFQSFLELNRAAFEQGPAADGEQPADGNKK